MMNILKNTKTYRLTPDPILCRFCVVSLILMIMGTVNVWGEKRDIYACTAVVDGIGGTAHVVINWKATGSGSLDSGGKSTSSSVLVTTGSKEDHWSWPTYTVIFTATPSTGYTFHKWYANADCTGDSTASNPYTAYTGKGPVNYLTYYAKFNPNNYTIQYDANRGGNSGTGTMDNTPAVYDASVTLRENAFTNDGLSAITVTYNVNGGSMASTSVTAGLGFKEWNTKSDGSGDKSYTDGETGVFNLAASGTATLYAQWQPETTLPSATKTNQVLEGWYSDSDLTSKVGRAGDKFNPSRDTTLYAKWIDKYTPSVTCAKTSLKVGEELSSALAFDDTLGITFVNIIKEISSVRSGNKVIEYDKANNKIYARNAGIDTLRFTQPDTTEIKSGVIDIVFTVSKHANAITCSWGDEPWSKNLTFDEEAGVTFSSDNDAVAPLVVTPATGSTIATYDGTNNKIFAHHNIGTASWTISQAEDYKYEAATTKTLSVNVGKIRANDVCYVLEDRNPDSFETNEKSKEFTFSIDQPGDTIYFDAMFEEICVLFCVGSTDNWALNYAVSGGSYQHLKDESNKDVYINCPSKDTYYSFKYAIPEDARKFQFDLEFGATGKKTVKNVRVSRKRWFKFENEGSSEISVLNMPKAIKGGNVTRKTFYLNYSTCASKIKLVSNNDHIKFAANDSMAYEFDVENGTRKAIELTYTSPADVENIAATITVYTPYEHETLTVNAETIDKYTPTITWTGATTTFEVGDDITNGFTVKNENGEPITGDLEWTFESDHEDVVDVDGTTLTAHTLDPATKGDIETATITGTLTAGETYYGGSQTVELTVKRKDNTITISGVKETMLVDATMTGISVTSTNSSGPSYTVTSMPGSDTIVYNLGAGTIVSKHITGPFSWTIHQAADGTYKAANAEFSVTVGLAPEDESEKIYMYDSGSNDDAGWKVSEFAAVDLVPVGVATTVWFDTKQDKSGDKNMWAEHYVNSAWSMFDSKARGSVTTSYNSLYKTGINSSATAFRFNSEDNNKVYVRNVKIQCRGHILTDVEDDELAITKQEDGESLIYLDTEGYETFTVYYGLAKNSGDVTLVCDNSHFKFGVEDEKEAGLTLVDNDAEHTQCGNQEVKVYYNPTDVGTETAHVTIYNSSYSKTITITGTCKYPQTISWNIGNRLKKDTENKISNAANATVGTITYSSNNTDVVEVTDGGTKLLAKATGSATITASATGNDIYYPATSTIDVTVVESLAKEAVEVDEIADWTGDVDIWTPVIVLADADIRITTEKVAYSLTIRSGASVTVASTGGLTIGEGGISGASASSLVLEAGDGNDGSVKGQTGYLRVSPRFTGDMPTAKVELYSIAYADNSNQTATWQYMGVPLGANIGGWDVCTYGEQFIYGWSESDGEWFDAYAETIRPFHGYCLTQNNNDGGRTFEFKGQLYAPSTKEISLSYAGDGDNKGYHVLANSYAAPIDITKFDVADFVNADATIYMFNTGSPDDVSENSEFAVDTYTTAGQYIAVTPRTASSIYSEDKTKTYPVLIPAMQGFCVKATAASASITLDYSKLVWNANYGTHPNKPLRAAAQKTEEQEASEPNVTDFIKVTLADGEAADILYLLASESYDKSYENGYDAPKMMSDDPALPNIFAVEDDGQFAIDATSDIEGTFIGVRTGAASNYTIYFSHVNAETEWMLLDIQENKKTRIANEASYSFSAKANSLLTNRFVIVEWDGNAGTATGTEETTIQNKIQKFIYNDQLLILKDGVLYDARGLRVR